MLANYNFTWFNSGVWGHYFAPTGAAGGQAGLFTYGLNPLSTNRYVKLAEDDGVIQIADGSQGMNKVLTSDANGWGSWQDPQTLGIWSLNGSTAIYDSGGIAVNTNTLAPGSIGTFIGGDVELIESFPFSIANSTLSTGNACLVMQETGSLRDILFVSAGFKPQT